MLFTLGRVNPFSAQARVPAARTRRSLRLRLALEPLEARQLLATAGKVGPAALAAALSAPPQALHARKKPPKPVNPATPATVTAGPDANGSVTLSGKTYPKAKVNLDLQANGTIEQTAK